MEKRTSQAETGGTATDLASHPISWEAAPVSYDYESCGQPAGLAKRTSFDDSARCPLCHLKCIQSAHTSTC